MFAIFPGDLESEGDLQETTVPTTAGTAKQEPKVNTQVSRGKSNQFYNNVLVP